MSAEIFKAHGGRPILPMGARSIDEVHPLDVTWNFGIAPSTNESTAMVQATPTFKSALPNLVGAWDGTTNVNHHDAVRKVLGKDIRAQKQPRGTCGGRAGSRSSEILQCILIATGQRAKFHYVSHAAIYYAARKKYGMLRGNPNDDSLDGVAQGSVPEILGEFGLVTRDADGDANDYGDGSDDLACKWGAGVIDAATAQHLASLGAEAIVTKKVRAESAQDCADGLAAGGVVCQADGQGYTMERDDEGFCSPQGTWQHYQTRSGVRRTPRGRKGFDYNQSWGDDAPSGPLLPGCPSNCFGVDWDVQDQLCHDGVVDILFAFPLWDLEKGPVDLPWVF